MRLGARITGKRRVPRWLPIHVSLLLLIILCLGGCWGGPPEDDDSEDAGTLSSQTTTASLPDSSVAGGNASQTPLKSAGAVLSFSGENPAYHTGIMSTPILFTEHQIDGGSVEAYADKTESFSEPLGSQTAKGNDVFTFHGSWDEEAGVLSGELSVATYSHSQGGDSPWSDITYEMVGDLQATRVPGTDRLEGTLTGSSQLAQEWEDNLGPAVDDQHSVSWTVSGTLHTE